MLLYPDIDVYILKKSQTPTDQSRDLWRFDLYWLWLWQLIRLPPGHSRPPPRSADRAARWASPHNSSLIFHIPALGFYFYFYFLFFSDTWSVSAVSQLEKASSGIESVSIGPVKVPLYCRDASSGVSTCPLTAGDTSFGGRSSPIARVNVAVCDRCHCAMLSAANFACPRVAGCAPSLLAGRCCRWYRSRFCNKVIITGMHNILFGYNLIGNFCVVLDNMLVLNLRLQSHGPPWDGLSCLLGGKPK